MRRSVVRTLVLALVLGILPVTAQAATATTCTPGAAACPVRIHFALGAYTAQVSMTMSPGATKHYVLRANQGQTMIVILKASLGARGMVTYPSGKSVGQPAGRIFDALLPSSGDYRITVGESPMGQPWTGPATLVIVIY